MVAHIFRSQQQEHCVFEDVTVSTFEPSFVTLAKSLELLHEWSNIFGNITTSFGIGFVADLYKYHTTEVNITSFCNQTSFSAERIVV